MRTHLAKCARNLPNVAQLVKCSAFDQLVKRAAHLATEKPGKYPLDHPQVHILPIALYTV